MMPILTRGGIPMDRYANTTNRRRFVGSLGSAVIAGLLPPAYGFEYLDSAFEPAEPAAPIDDLQPRMIGVLEFPRLLDHEEFKEIQLNQTDAVVLFEGSTGDTVARHVRSAKELELGGYPYKDVAVAVSARANNRYRVNLEDGGFGWVTEQLGGVYTPLLSLLAGQLCFLRRSWDGRLYAGPSLNSKVVRMKTDVRADFDGYVPVEVRDHAPEGLQLWLEVQVFPDSSCVVRYPERLGLGWIPLYAVDGKAVVDFYSGGC